MRRHRWLWLFLVPPVYIAAHAAVSTYEINCVEHNLKMLQLASLQYEQEHHDQRPSSIRELLAQFQIAPEKVLTNPLTGHETAGRYGMTTWKTRGDCDSSHSILFFFESNGGSYIVQRDATVLWDAGEARLHNCGAKLTHGPD